MLRKLLRADPFHRAGVVELMDSRALTQQDIDELTAILENAKEEM